MTEPLRTLVYDVEIYADYFLLAFRNVDTGNVRCFEMFEGQDLDLDTIRSIFRSYRVVSFNGNGFDLPLITEALQGADCARLKRIANRIIEENVKPWTMGIENIPANHIDLIEVAPGIASLKIYGGRMHCRRMQDLPIAPDASISPEQREQLRTYCVNDLETTQALYEKLKPQIELREKMSESYGIDLRSKSDAQIAEAVICHRLEKVLGHKVRRPENVKKRFNYLPPSYAKFETQSLRDVLALAGRVEFIVPDSGKVELPPELAKAAIRIGSGVYRMGIGGLHSSEQTVTHFADDTCVLRDHDVASYYPSLILNQGLFPDHLGPIFLKVLRDLVDERLAAKYGVETAIDEAIKSDLIAKRDGGKTVVVSAFGKMGSKWSKLFAPNLMIQTTLTGQLSLLMLIERLEAAGVPVVSANTDGIVIKCPTDKVDTADRIIAEWEVVTDFKTEETRYKALHSRDVNNYLGFKEGGGVKLKGVYAPPGLQKNPTNVVCVLAVIAFLTDLVPVEETIRACQDIRQFVTVRTVNGGALDQSDAYLGKAVRWYYARGVEGCLRYKLNGYTVARSEGARAVMQLPDVLPDDVDHDWYVRESLSILADVGVDPAAYQIRDLV